MKTTGTTLLIGIGSEARGDDAAGLEVARLLSANPPPGWRIEQATGEATDLIMRWVGAERVIVVDAAQADWPAGTIVRLDGLRAVLPAQTRQTSTHATGLATAVRLARALGLLPSELVLLAVCGECWCLGTGLSPAVAVATRHLAARLTGGEFPAAAHAWPDRPADGPRPTGSGL